MLKTRLVINDVSDEVEEEYDDGLPEGSDELEDRGDVLPDDLLEVDEDILAALAKDDDKDKDTGMIPKARFNEVNEEKKSLKEKVDALEAQIAAGIVPPVAAAPVVPAVPAVEFDVNAQEDAYIEAITEGDAEKAREIRAAIRQYERDSLKAEMLAESKQLTEADKVASRKQDVVDQALIDFPALDSKSETFDKGLLAKVNRMNSSYLNEGVPADKALAMAIADFLEPVNPAVDAPEALTPAARAKAAAALKAQPPGLTGIGIGERAAAANVDVAKMTDSEYDALPESEKKRLRGD